MDNKVFYSIAAVAAVVAGYFFFKKDTGSFQAKFFIKNTYNDMPIDGASVNIEGVGTRFTDATGYAIFTNTIAPGVYNVFVSAPGYYDNGDTINISASGYSGVIDLPPR